MADKVYRRVTEELIHIILNAESVIKKRNRPFSPAEMVLFESYRDCLIGLIEESKREGDLDSKTYQNRLQAIEKILTASKAMSNMASEHSAPTGTPEG